MGPPRESKQGRSEAGEYEDPGPPSHLRHSIREASPIQGLVEVSGVGRCMRGEEMRDRTDNSREQHDNDTTALSTLLGQDDREFFSLGEMKMKKMIMKSTLHRQLREGRYLVGENVWKRWWKRARHETDSLTQGQQPVSAKSHLDVLHLSPQVTEYSLEAVHVLQQAASDCDFYSGSALARTVAPKSPDGDERHCPIRSLQVPRQVAGTPLSHTLPTSSRLHCARERGFFSPLLSRSDVFVPQRTATDFIGSPVSPAKHLTVVHDVPDAFPVFFLDSPPRLSSPSYLVQDLKSCLTAPAMASPCALVLQSADTESWGERDSLFDQIESRAALTLAPTLLASTVLPDLIVNPLASPFCGAKHSSGSPFTPPLPFIPVDPKSYRQASAALSLHRGNTMTCS
ncbi:hypothetical protein L249_3806 [Ophiocordyceps polyrhachis-furcata BCC 54312]|uniref:Uncharacterized protein n=1 Tax=Ophiocordyceps polyrhachis-furcata BCC 54312 TaxID=1330021 RepID=A0A367L5F3_9HYPO|nr:hypothetical protein L249_3806 [Ophiocordyceps polyrhachis-furcata BCC 54312]